MININTNLIEKVREIVNELLPGRKVNSNYKDDSSNMHHKNRYIQVATSFPKLSTIHFEYQNGHWWLHIESPSESDGYKYSRIVNYLKEQTSDIQHINWFLEGTWCGCRLNEVVDSDEQIREGLKYLSQTFDPLIEECATKFKRLDSSAKYELESDLLSMEEIEEVSLKTMSLVELFEYNLTIPDYQRIYCWENSNIQTLWKNLEEIPEKQEYHLGAVILQIRGNDCDIIDGQQRLVTLTLILRALGYSNKMPLLLQKFESQEACDNIANAKYIIDNLVGWDMEKKKNLLDKILNLSFSVLVLNSDNIDLAYTFFSNQNSRGVRLSDYDILKAHHLRFLITNESQSEHLARRWNAMSQELEPSSEPLLHNTLGLHLFRMRKWMRLRSCDVNTPRPVKEEFSAAPLIPGIPPFGERFYFYEKIQGGAHFFAYTEHFVELYKQFVFTPHVAMLRKYLLGESHWKYESVIETVLFAYYSKYGMQYLSEALYCIAGVMAQHRYEQPRALQYMINQHAQKSELVMMIDQASSPSFFLAESLPLIRKSGHDLENSDIRSRFYQSLRKVFIGLSDPSVIQNPEKFRAARFTDNLIETKKINEYG